MLLVQLAFVEVGEWLEKHEIINRETRRRNLCGMCTLYFTQVSAIRLICIHEDGFYTGEHDTRNDRKSCIHKLRPGATYNKFNLMTGTCSFLQHQRLPSFGLIISHLHGRYDSSAFRCYEHACLIDVGTNNKIRTTGAQILNTKQWFMMG